ncbi:hypothetical protein SODALDRAFT_347047 [Sodiomyces alkalinus F11]|uniref:Granulins domain-containing protein n=1 Tax=Sodiomyces alkalinus (strain CBS 110278 / VKM F-3762 / F11) TaxID=1314773 RepID=A0A3N2Q568_SODAK|nr:hypothetical protein SODALDRAFT_347047 [Sodiomyces alkalinus F11]ROT41913.1 hypothetical protein SODALDRAFT_347047 [Sodiomyces alkalinus F11]
MRVFQGFSLFGVPWVQWLATMGPSMGPQLAHDPVPTRPNPFPTRLLIRPRWLRLTGKPFSMASSPFPPRDSETVDHPLVKKDNELACPTYTVNCNPLHDHCCPLTTTCCNNGCCPRGHSICEKGGFCPKGHQCVQGSHCCPRGTTYCGGACVTGACCSADFFCRGPGETCCGGPAHYVPEPNWRYGPWRTEYGVCFGRDQVNSPLVRTGGWRCCSGSQVCGEGNECRWSPRRFFASALGDGAL